MKNISFQYYWESRSGFKRWGRLSRHPEVSWGALFHWVLSRHCFPTPAWLGTQYTTTSTCSHLSNSDHFCCLFTDPLHFKQTQSAARFRARFCIYTYTIFISALFYIVFWSFPALILFWIVVTSQWTDNPAAVRRYSPPFFSSFYNLVIYGFSPQ